MSTGVVYVATGNKYINEACFSASTLKNYMPSIHTTLFTTDKKYTHPVFDEVVVIQSSHNGYLDKIIGISKSPYEYTLFLDTDTYICSNFSELFTLLEKYDIGAVHAELRAGKNELGESYNYQDLRDNNGNFLYPMYNSGVILYKKSNKVDNFFLNG